MSCSAKSRIFPYQRPPLSKKYLLGEMPQQRLQLKPAAFYEHSSLEMHLGTRISEIDTNAKTVVTANDECCTWDKLVIATGSRVRRLPVDGAKLDGVHYLRTIEDVDSIRTDAEHAQHAVIIGAGYIGLEVAAVLNTMGLQVTVVEMAERVMSRVVSPEISDFYQIEHADRGVRLRLGSSIQSISGDERAAAVVLSDGETLAADLVVVGIGIEPNSELAASAGLVTDDGIVVDDRCATSNRDVYAIGDCTRHPNPVYQRDIRLESVHNALEQAKTAASNICDKEDHYGQVPWFWSDQYDLKLQIAGLSEGYDEIVIRGNPADRSFACLYLKGGVLIAIDAVNAPRDFMQSKALIGARKQLASKDLADSRRSLQEFI